MKSVIEDVGNLVGGSTDIRERCTNLIGSVVGDVGNLVGGGIAVQER